MQKAHYSALFRQQMSEALIPICCGGKKNMEIQHEKHDPLGSLKRVTFSDVKGSRIFDYP